MKITQIKPTEGNLICNEELLEKKETKILLDESVKAKIEQKVYKIRCVPDKCEYKVGQKVIISLTPTINAIKVADVIYPVVKVYDVIGVVEV